MIIVRVELHSAINGQVTEIARAIIVNKGGTADGKLGSYDVGTFRGRSKQALDGLQIQRRGKVENHPRLSQHVWHLVAKALAAMGYGATARASGTVQALAHVNALPPAGDADVA